jgi:excisionase family DNA binding protein
VEATENRDVKALPSSGTTTVPSRETIIDLAGAPDTYETELTVSQVAKRLAINSSTVHRYISAGRLRARKVPGVRGEQWMIPITEIAAIEPPASLPLAPDPQPQNLLASRLMDTMTELMAAITSQQRAITAGEERLAGEREQRARAEERLVALEEVHRIRLETEAILAVQAQRERDEATSRALAKIEDLDAARIRAEHHAKLMDEWALVVAKRRWRRPPPPPTMPQSITFRP